MPYCKQWRIAMFPDYAQKGAYVNYKGVKEILHKMKVENLANRTKPEDLLAELEKQKERVYDWCAQKVNELIIVARSLEKCSRRFDTTIKKQTNMSAENNNTSDDKVTEVLKGDSTYHDGALVEHIKLAADAILYELLRFHECRNLNTNTIEHIIHRQFRYTPLQPTGQWVALGKYYDYLSIPLDEVFYLLSVVYERVRITREGEKNVEKLMSGAVGSQVFDRRSVKYWVHPQDLPFVMARVIQHLPVSTIKDTYSEYEKAKVPYKLGQRISSVYFDNSNFLFYHRRLERLESSSLIRFRWYTDTFEKDMNALKPNSDVYAEMKVHHEAWSGERSTKKRFALKEKDVDKFLHGQLSLEPAIEKLKKKGADSNEIRKFQELTSDIFRKVKAYGMQPVLRTQCTRVAFQRGFDQSVRVSIDTNLCISSEDFGLSGHWRIEGQPLAQSYFPYAVVEVKLQCADNERLPVWIEELLKCRYMESVPKFSKFGHGIAMLFGHTNRIRYQPYWCHQLNADIRAAFKPEDDKWDPTVGLVQTLFQRLVDRIIFGSSPAQTDTVGASQCEFLPGDKYGRIYYQMVRGFNSISDNVKTYHLERRHEAFLVMINSHPVETICFQGYGNAKQTELGGDIPWQTGKRVKVPQKFDPKTLLTAERYMLKWVQKGTMLGLMGLAVLRFGNGNNMLRSQSSLQTYYIHVPFYFFSILHVWIGATLAFMSVLILFYALLVLQARSLRVYGRKKIRFDSVKGPTFLTFFVLACFLAITLNTVLLRYGPMLSGSDIL